MLFFSIKMGNQEEVKFLERHKDICETIFNFDRLKKVNLFNSH
jgi:hypothetical protein